MGFEILAAIDLLGGQVVRLRRGAFDDATVYGTDPAATAARLVDGGVRWLHVVDLDGARAGRPVHRAEIAAILEAASGRAAVEVGGGLRDDAAASGLLADGVDRVVLGTAALARPELAGRLVARHGRERIAVAIDVRGGLAVGDAWQAGAEGRRPDEAIRPLQAEGITTFEVTSVDRDGTLEGPDLDLLRRLVDLGAGAMVGGGGIRHGEDVAAIRELGCAGAILGRALYEGRVDVRSLLETA